MKVEDVKEDLRQVYAQFNKTVKPDAALAASGKFKEKFEGDCRLCGKVIKLQIVGKMKRIKISVQHIIKPQLKETIIQQQLTSSNNSRSTPTNKPTNATVNATIDKE
jgi:hypothetical protein